MRAVLVLFFILNRLIFAQAQFKVGLMASPILGISYNDKKEIFPVEYKKTYPNYNFGVVLNYQRKKIGLESGILYTTRKHSFLLEPSGFVNGITKGSNSFNLRLFFIEVPVSIKKTFHTKTIDHNMMLGGSARFFDAASFSFKNKLGTINDTDWVNLIFIGGSNSIIQSLELSTFVGYSISKNRKFECGVELSYDLNPQKITYYTSIQVGTNPPTEFNTILHPQYFNLKFRLLYWVRTFKSKDS